MPENCENIANEITCIFDKDLAPNNQFVLTIPVRAKKATQENGVINTASVKNIYSQCKNDTDCTANSTVVTISEIPPENPPQTPPPIQKQQIPSAPKTGNSPLFLRKPLSILLIGGAIIFLIFTEFKQRKKS